MHWNMAMWVAGLLIVMENEHCTNKFLMYHNDSRGSWFSPYLPLLYLPPFTSILLLSCSCPHIHDGCDESHKLVAWVNYTTGYRNHKHTSCSLNHEGVEGTTLTKPQLDVLHVDLHTILEHLLVPWTQTGTDLFYGALKDLHLICITVCIW
jgi:hypothetical protein